MQAEEKDKEEWIVEEKDEKEEATEIVMVKEVEQVVVMKRCKNADGGRSHRKGSGDREGEKYGVEEEEVLMLVDFSLVGPYTIGSLSMSSLPQHHPFQRTPHMPRNGKIGRFLLS